MTAAKAQDDQGRNDSAATAQSIPQARRTKRPQSLLTEAVIARALEVGEHRARAVGKAGKATRSGTELPGWKRKKRPEASSKVETQTVATPTPASAQGAMMLEQLRLA